MNAPASTAIIAIIGKSGANTGAKAVVIAENALIIPGINEVIINSLNAFIALTTMASFLNNPPTAVMSGPPK